MVPEKELDPWAAWEYLDSWKDWRNWNHPAYVIGGYLDEAKIWVRNTGSASLKAAADIPVGIHHGTIVFLPNARNRSDYEILRRHAGATGMAVIQLL